MARRKPSRSPLDLNELTVLAVWLILLYLVYRRDPEGSKQAVASLGQMFEHVLPSK